jgi:hypothetical protein
MKRVAVLVWCRDCNNCTVRTTTKLSTLQMDNTHTFGVEFAHKRLMGTIGRCEWE